ncbi:hypothetical protein CCHL11_02472, partial [Colletotrichum chlorophyti]
WTALGKYFRSRAHDFVKGNWFSRLVDICEPHIRSAVGQYHNVFETYSQAFNTQWDRTYQNAASTTNTVSNPWTLPSEESQPGSTTQLPIITNLPPGAELLPLTESVTYTTPVWVTTTKPGSSDPTIVPVIFPIIGPPLICFSCIPFPPRFNLQIKLPELCVQFFGIKIGFCPPGEKYKGSDGGGGGGGEGENEKEKEKDKPSEKPDEPESTAKSATTTSTSSCTITVTATHHTVFCSVTRDINFEGSKSQTLASTTCLTSAYTTITGCSVINSATTVTTTRSASTELVHPSCVPKTCGRSACSAKKPSIDRLSSRAIHKRQINPQRGMWIDPISYQGSYYTFMPDQIRDMREPQVPMAEYDRKLVKLPPEDTNDEEASRMVTSEWILFKDKVAAIGVEQLTGCTAVLIMSKRGAWVARLYENVMEDEELLEEAIEQLHLGIDPDDPLHKYSQYGIDNLKNNPDIGEHGVMFGNDEDPNHDQQVWIVIVAPRPRPRYVEQGYVFPDSHIQNPRINEGQLMYPSSIDKLREDLLETFNSPSLRVVDYPPPMLELMELRIANSAGGALDDTLRDVLADKDLFTWRGKVIMQYMPAQECDSPYFHKPKWRILADVHGMVAQNAWETMEGQLFRPPPGLTRREAACPMPLPDPSGREFPDLGLSQEPASPTATRAFLSRSDSRAQSITLSSTGKGLRGGWANATTRADKNENKNCEEDEDVCTDLAIYGCRKCIHCGFFDSFLRVCFKLIPIFFDYCYIFNQDENDPDACVNFNTAVTIHNRISVPPLYGNRKQGGRNSYGVSTIYIYQIQKIPPSMPGGFQNMFPTFHMYSKEINDKSWNPCTADVVGRVVVAETKAVQLPPKLTAGKDVYGRKGCVYHTDEGVGFNEKKKRGRLVCDDEKDVQCTEDPSVNVVFPECSRSTRIHRMWARMECKLPPTTTSKMGVSSIGKMSDLGIDKLGDSIVSSMGSLR